MSAKFAATAADVALAQGMLNQLLGLPRGPQDPALTDRIAACKGRRTAVDQRPVPHEELQRAADEIAGLQTVADRLRAVASLLDPMPQDVTVLRKLREETAGLANRVREPGARIAAVSHALAYREMRADDQGHRPAADRHGRGTTTT